MQIRILVFIPMWKRRRVMDWSLRSLDAALAQAPWIKADKFAVVSRGADFDFSADRGFYCFYADNDTERLGAKFNSGMAHALETREFDFVFQMNSDTVLRPDFFSHARAHLEAGKLMTGINIIGFIETSLDADEADAWVPNTPPAAKQGNPISKQNKGTRFRCGDSLIRYNYAGGCGIRFIARSAIEQAGYQRHALPLHDMSAARIAFCSGIRAWVPRMFWKPEKFADGLPEVFRLWPEAPRGLDNASHKVLCACYPELAIHPFFGGGQMLALDVKSGQNLWPIDNFADGQRIPLSSPDGQAALAAFPILQEIQKFC